MILKIGILKSHIYTLNSFTLISLLSLQAEIIYVLPKPLIDTDVCDMVNHHIRVFHTSLTLRQELVLDVVLKMYASSLRLVRLMT